MAQICLKNKTMQRLLEICLLIFGLIANSEAYIPENAKKCITQLNDYYDNKKTVSETELFNGKPLFWKRLDGFEMAEQKLLMTIILDSYDRILTQMHHEAKDENVQNNLTKVKEYLNTLKMHYFSGKHNDVKKHAKEVMALKETDPVVQRKALFELVRIYNDASKLGNPSAQNPRRRRQAKSAKKHHSKS